MLVTELVAELGLERGAETRSHSTASRCQIEQGMYRVSKWRYLSALSCMVSLSSLFLKRRSLHSLEAFSYGNSPPPRLDVEALQSANILSQAKLFWS